METTDEFTIEWFNYKWGKHLEEGHYGLIIHNPMVIKHLDHMFELLLELNPNFTYSQIKVKNGFARVYINGLDNHEGVVKYLEEFINYILKR
jgi:hypothetical protein